MTLFEKTVRRDSNTDKYESLQEAYMKVLNNEPEINEKEIAGWIAIFNGNKLEIKKSEANGIYGAKQLAIKKLKVPKSKQGLLAIEPAYESTIVEELDMRTIKRYIPTGAKVMAALGTKSLKLTFIDTVSAPPLTTADIKSAEMRLKKNVEMFVKDVGSSIKLKGVDYEPYVFLQGQKNSIDFVYSFRLNVSTKPEEKKLEKLYQALK